MVSRLNLRQDACSVAKALSSSVKISLACCLQKYSISSRLDSKLPFGNRNPFSRSSEASNLHTHSVGSRCSSLGRVAFRSPIWSFGSEQHISACQARPQNSFLSSGQGCVNLPSAAHAAKAGQQVDDLPAAGSGLAAGVSRRAWNDMYCHSHRDLISARVKRGVVFRNPMDTAQPHS